MQRLQGSGEGSHTSPPGSGREVPKHLWTPTQRNREKGDSGVLSEGLSTDSHALAWKLKQQNSSSKSARDTLSFLLQDQGCRTALSKTEVLQV